MGEISRQSIYVSMERAVAPTWERKGLNVASHEKKASPVPKSQSQERGLPSLAVLAAIGAFGLAAGWLNSRILTGTSGAVTTFRHSSWNVIQNSPSSSL